MSLSLADINTKPKIQFISGHITSFEGSRQKRGITSDQSFHTLDLLEINDAATGPVFLHDVVIIGSAADEKFYVDSDQHIELVVSVNMPRMEMSGNGMSTIKKNRSIVYAMRLNEGNWHGKDAALLLGKKNQEIGEGYTRALILFSPLLLIAIASIALAGPAIFMTFAMLKTRKSERVNRMLYPRVDEIRSILEAKTTIRF